MPERSRRDLLQQRTTAATSKPLDLSGTATVAIGQVRRLRAYDDDMDSMLVVVLALNSSAGTATVVAAASPADHATTRDVVVRREGTGFPFDLYLMVDGLATVWTTQLQGTPTVGTLPHHVTEFAQHAHRLPTEQLSIHAAAAGAEAGTLTTQTGDHMWWQRGRVAEHLGRLSDSCHNAALAPLVADPAILSTLITRGDDMDWAATISMLDAYDAREVVVTDENWECSAAALSSAHAHPDVMRLIQGRFIDTMLRARRGPADDLDFDEQVVESLPERELPSGLLVDPLARLLSHAAASGYRSTHVWTSPHLWREETAVTHVVVHGSRHALITNYGVDAEEMA